MRNLIFLLFLLSSCSNKQLYRAGQDYEKSKCTENAMSPQQLVECLKNDSKSYDEYQKQRKDVNKK